MKSYTLPRPKMWLMLTLLIVTCFGTPFVAIMLQHSLLGLDGMTEFNSRYGGPLVIFIAFPLLVTIVVLALTRKLYYKKASVTLDSTKFSVRESNGNLLFEGPVACIHAFFFMNQDNGTSLKIWDVQGKLIASFTSNILVGSKCVNDMRKLFNDLCEVTQATAGKTIPKGSAWSKPGTYYHSTTSRADALPADSIRKNVKKKNIKGAVIGFALIIVFMVAVFYFLAGSKGRYELDDNGNVVYNGKVLAGVNPEEFESYGYHTGKDSAYVYFKGERQEQLDAKTFESIDGHIFADKNGLYREPRWVGSELEPLEGIDKATFRSVGDRLYVDRSHVYSLDLMASNPLVPMKGDNAPDPATFEEIPNTYSFYRDARYVYHSSIYGRLKRSNEIDRNTFEALTYRVFKDKNHVYFLTFDLKQDGGNENEESSDYDILRDADAASFTKISDTEFEDKYTTWSIESRDRNTAPSSSKRRPRTR